MTGYEFGDVVLVPFPFTGQTATKKRPAVVVSSAAYQQNRDDLIVMPITSQSRPSNPFGEMVVGEWKGISRLCWGRFSPEAGWSARCKLRKEPVSSKQTP